MPMDLWITKHLDWLEARGYAQTTVRARRRLLRRFARWSSRLELTEPGHFTLARIEDYRLDLYARRRSDGEALGWGSHAQALLAIKGLFRWLTLMGVLTSNPAADVELPRRGRQLPRKVLTRRQVDRVLGVPDIRTSLGLRHRCLLEVLYSTAIRRAECARLELGDLDLERRVALIREGKGRNDRYVPIGRRAVVWLRHYLRRARHKLLSGARCEAVFVSRLRGPISSKRVGGIAHDCLGRAGLGGFGSCHLFRHSAATLMLEGGADIRDIQELLGHAQLSTTALYARVSIARLQAVHRRTHPAG